MGWELVTINSIVSDSSPVTLTSTNVTNATPTAITVR
jgi:hypothetical protein